MSDYVLPKPAATRRTLKAHLHSVGVVGYQCAPA